MRSPQRSLEELALYEGLRRGSGRAFRELVELHQAGMLRVAGWYLSDPGDRERLVRRAWLVALDGLNMFTWQTTLRAWLFGILVSAGRASRARGDAPRGAGDVASAGRDTAGPPSAGGGGRGFDWVHLPWAREWSAGAAAVLAGGLGALPTDEREAVGFRDVEGWALRETCDVLGLTVAEAHRVLHGGRARLIGWVRADLGVPGCGTCDTPGVRVTQHLEEPSEEFAQHLAGCAVCACRLGQVRGLLAALALLGPDAGAAPVDPELVAAFRRWRAGRGLRIWHRVRPLGAWPAP